MVGDVVGGKDVSGDGVEGVGEKIIKMFTQNLQNFC